MSAVLATASPRRIKATHRRRRKVTVGRFVQRYYDPAIGRFLSVDPVSTNPNTGASFTRYSYANNNPYRFTDPDGRAAAGTGNGRVKNDWDVGSLSPKEKRELVYVVAAKEKIDMSNVAKVEVGASGTVTSQTVPGVMILIADSAFATRTHLATVIAHEVETHGVQIERNGNKGPNDSTKDPQRARWEATAYRREVENGPRFHAPASEVAQSAKRYAEFKPYGEDAQDRP